VAEMLRMTDTLDRVRRTIALMDALDAENLPGAIEGYEDNLTRVEPHESRLFANAWARIDPRGALDRMLEAWTYPKIAFQSVEEVVYVWARSDDAAGARAYVDPSIAAANKRYSPTSSTVLAVLKALGVAREYAELTRLFEALAEDPSRELFLTEVMIEMNRVDGIPSVKAWIASVPWDIGDGLKKSALNRGLDWSSKMSGEVAASWYEEIESHPEAIDVLPMAVAGWGVRDPSASMVWLAERPASRTRDQLLRRIAVGWLDRRPEQAEPWLLETLDGKEIWDLILLPLTNFRLGQHRYEEAVAFAERVPNERERNHVLAIVLRKWSEFDEAAVEAHIVEANVPDSVVAQMRKQLEGPIRTKRRKVKSAPKDEG